MKRSPEQLQAGLSRRLAPVYLITGDEPLQQKECADAVRAAARARGFDERVVFSADTGIEWAALRFEADSLSLFASRRLLELRLGETRPGTDGAAAIAEYCSRPAEDVVLLMTAAKLDGRTQQTEWYKAIDRAGEIIRVRPVQAEEMPQWIGRRLTAAGVQATAEAVRLLADRVEGNLLAAAQDIDKLTLLAADREIGAQEVLHAVGDSARYDLFTLADCAFAGNGARAVRMLRGLRDEGVEPILVCWLLVRELRAACLLAQGTRPDEVIAGYRLFPPRENQLRAAIRRHGTGALRAMLRYATGIDRIIKGGGAGEPWDDLTTLCLHLSGRRFGELQWTR